MDNIKNNYLRRLISSNKKLKLYGLQMANMVRIRENDNMYIFDEVGSGKTISAGLSIIELIYNQSFKNILIITDNSVIHQFKRNLKEVLGLEIKEDNEYYYDREFNVKYNIKIINQINTNINYEINKQYDCIIVDEAHKFLNQNTERYKSLTKLSSKKAIFMTATPIKNGKEDISTYAKMGALITKKDEDRLKERLLWEISDPELLCKSFNPYSPITRYFKDVTRNLDIGDTESKSPVRLVPQVWDSMGYKKEYMIFKNIFNILEKNSGEKNRFIIFANRIEEVDRIAEYFDSDKLLNGKCFEEFSLCETSDKYTYVKLTGGLKNKEKLSEVLSSNNQDINLPTVIVTNYHTSEVGLDFPGYNYIVNYHINKSPSNSEQRFGRIDRMNSLYNELNMCFVINSKDVYDTNSKNFYFSMYSYMCDLLTFLPSKNILITDETPKILIENYQPIYNEYNKFIRMCEKKLVIEFIYNFYKEGYMYSYNFEAYYNDKGSKTDDMDDIKEFQLFLINNLGILEIEESDEFWNSVMKKIKQKRDKVEKQLVNIKTLSDKLKNISNKILYSYDETSENLYSISSIDSNSIVDEIKISKKYKYFESNILKD